MKVTPVKKKFGRYQVGQAFELPDRSAKALIKAGKLAAVAEVELPPLVSTHDDPEQMRVHAGLYQHRMMAAETTTIGRAVVEAAPYGYKADGTPRKRPGRTKAAE